MDTTTRAARIDLTLVSGEDFTYVVELTDWGGKEPVAVTNCNVSGVMRGVRGEEEWELGVEVMGEASNCLVVSFPEEAGTGMYYVVAWGDWGGDGRVQLVEGMVGVERSRKEWPVRGELDRTGRRRIFLRVPDGLGGRIRAEVLGGGYAGAMALRAEAAAKSAAGSAEEAAGSELVAKAAEAVAKAAEAVIEESRKKVELLEGSAVQAASRAERAANRVEGEAEAAAGSAAAAAGSEAAAAESAAAAAKSEGSAVASATWASNSATSAAGSATDARDSATAAAGSATAAADYATGAGLNADAAAGSAAAAAKSEAAAGSAAEEAAGSATSAAGSEEEAAGSATSAAGSASRAEAAAARVEGEAAAAAASAESAAGSASRAEAAANRVEGEAAAAAKSAAAAAGSEAAAAGSAERAQEAEGKASFELWQENGHPGGTVQEYLEDLRGKSAYEVWLAQGNVGTEDDFLKSLKGKDGLNAGESAAVLIEEHAEDRLLHPTKTRQAGWDNKLEEADVYTREGAELSSKPHMANDGAEVADAFGRYVGIGQADLVFQGECEAWELASLTIRCRDTAIGNVGDAAYYLGVYERVEGGSEGDFKWVGTSKDKVQQQLGEDSTWHFERTVIHRRNLRFILFAERDDPWPADGEGVQIGVRMAGKTGQSGGWTGFGGFPTGFENTYCPIVELKYYKLKSKYAGEALQGVVDGHVGDKTAHVTSTERAKWDKAAEHAGDTTVHVTASEKATWNGKVSTERLNNHTGDTTRHVTASEKATWNGKVSTETFNAHANDTTRHVTANEKATWNGKAEAETLSSHTGDTTVHVTAGEKSTWNGKADADTLSSHMGDTTVHVTSTEKAAWNGKLGSSVGGLTDVRFYANEEEAPALERREAGVVYLVGE